MTQPIAPLASSLPANDRLRANVERLFTAMLPMLSYLVVWEYTVVAVVPGLLGFTVDAIPVDLVRCPCGPLSGIQVWKGPSGSPSAPVVGSKVLVRFHDANPAKPAVCGFDPSVPTIPPPGPAPVPGAPLSLAGALQAFALLLASGTPTAAPAAAALEAYLVGLM
jgi:hypothetical protein